MFNELVESTTEKQTSYKSWSVPASGAIQMIAVGALILAPLFYTQALPKSFLNLFLLAPSSPAHIVARLKSNDRFLQSHRSLARPMTAPAFIPRSIARTADDLSTVSDILGVQQTAVFEDIPSSNDPAIAKPPDVVPPAGNSISRIRQGGVVQQAMLISQAKPIYPSLAIQIHLQGDVILHAIIDKQGRVAELEVVTGHPLLIQSAINAVRQWRYRPTMLNGDPAEVDTTIIISFKLG
jgi:protein TonB